MRLDWRGAEEAGRPGSVWMEEVGWLGLRSEEHTSELQSR